MKYMKRLMNKVGKDIINEMPWMEGSNINIEKHDANCNKDMVSHDCRDYDTLENNDNDYYTISLSKNIELEGGEIIPKIVKIHIENGKVSNIIESR